jgi:uncharacterized protein YjbJ (UPF0337 family)
VEWDYIENNWGNLRDKVKAKFPKLTNEDIAHIAGRKYKLIGTLEQKYKVSVKDATKQAEDFAKSLSAQKES